MAGLGMRAFANGGTGLLGEGGRPEGVFPLVQASGGDLGVKGVTPQVNVVVNTRPGETAKVSQEGNTLTIDIIEQALAARVAKGGSPLPRAHELAYGFRRS
jgi:hypothetical protein